MTILDIFSGSKSVSNAFKLCGHKVLSVDIVREFEPDICIDILNLRRSLLPEKVDVVWMSPPCTVYSLLSLAHHWESVKIGYRSYFHVPKTSEALHAIKVLRASIRLLAQINPKYYFIENPRGGMRHAGELCFAPYRRTVQYFDYGFEWAKPTDIFTNFDGWRPARKRRATGKMPVTEIPTAYERSKVPEKLIMEICRALEEDFRNDPRKSESAMFRGSVKTALARRANGSGDTGNHQYKLQI